MWSKIKNYWPLVFIAVAAFIAWSLAGRRKHFLKELADRKEEIDKTLEVKKLVVEGQHAAAVQKVQLEHRELTARLDAAQRNKIAAMSKDPVALNKWLYELARDDD